MGFIEATKTCLKKYFQMSGRASRSEYWWFFLAIIIATVIAALMDLMLFDTPKNIDESGPIEGIVGLLLIIPNFTASIRRLHDTNRSGWYLLVPLAGVIFAIFVGKMIGSTLGQGGPIIVGIIIILSFLLPIWWQTRPSNANPNKFGPNPHEVPS